MASVDGTQIMRPMWVEFPDDPLTFDLSSQFMFGPSLLVAPKLTDATSLSSKQTLLKTKLYKQHFEENLPKTLLPLFPIDLYLPAEAIWYDYYTKKEEFEKGVLIKGRMISDDKQGIFVKGGSILPIKLHNGELSLLRA